MKADVTPIKRSPHLVALSREHHDGLLFVWKIRQGIKKGVEPRRLSAFANWFWENHLQDHFKKEEQDLPQVISINQPVMAKMFEEHEAIESKIKEVVNRPDYEDLDRLARIVECHIRFEERELFNLVEQVATPEQLEALSNHIASVPHGGDSWTDKFWIGK